MANSKPSLRPKAIWAEGGQKKRGNAHQCLVTSLENQDKPGPQQILQTFHTPAAEAVFSQEELPNSPKHSSNVTVIIGVCKLSGGYSMHTTS